MTALLGVLAGSLLAMVLYLRSPQQRWRPGPLHTRTTITLGVLFATAANALFRRVLGPAESVYALLLVLMIVLAALPFVAAALDRERPRP